MCGICGKLVLDGRSNLISRDVLRRMMDAMRHRGPDDSGMYACGQVGLGHRRLSVIDLNTGTQPITNEDGTIWIVFNGEIYNFKELKAFLIGRGHRFRTSTDTEVIVHLYEELGEDFISKLSGMFAFAIWNEREKTLILARDRVGIKPLYYHLDHTALIFASEVKAIQQDPSVIREIDPTALATFLTYFYTPGEKTLLKNICKLSAGHYLVATNGNVKVKKYWDLQFDKAEVNPSLNEAATQLNHLLRETVRYHMISDVPVGVLLSGGVDSTAMLSFAVEDSGRRVDTFTVGFEGALCTDERPYARCAARKYGTRHHEMTVRPSEFLHFLPKYVWHMEEPVCEPPAIALYFVSRLAKDSGITVLISGEGGDEAFAGYQNYRNLLWLERVKGSLGPLRRPASALFIALSKLKAFGRLEKYGQLMNYPLDTYYYSRSSNPFMFFNEHRREFYSAQLLASLNGSDPAQLAKSHFAAVKQLKKLDQMLYVDTKSWLPDDLLIKADKMTMACSVELRVPLLDHAVLEFAASLPTRFKLQRFTTKYILKQALSERIPRKIRDRRKAGFPVPYEGWIRNECRDTVLAVLTDKKTIKRDLFRQDAVEALVRANSNGDNYSKEIFSLVILELWQREFIDRESVTLS
jgi:asparagine synthase (glutamine-hydrolysing)